MLSKMYEKVKEIDHGPMEYIPNYIARKHGKEKIEYDLPWISGTTFLFS